MMDMDELARSIDKDGREYLKKFFANLPGYMLEAFQMIHMDADETLVTEGQDADMVYVLLKGKLAAVDYRVREMAYGFIEFKPVEVLGAMEAYLGQKAYRTTLMTISPCILLQAKRELFEKWILSDPQAYQMQAKSIISYLLEEVRKERLYVMTSGVDRVYLVLCEMYRTHARDGLCTIYISRKQFASSTGVSERTITRTLKELEQKDLISRDGWDIVITEEQIDKIRTLVSDKVSMSDH